MLLLSRIRHLSQNGSWLRNFLKIVRLVGRLMALLAFVRNLGSVALVRLARRLSLDSLITFVERLFSDLRLLLEGGFHRLLRRGAHAWNLSHLNLRHFLKVLDRRNRLHFLITLRYHLSVILLLQDLGLFIRRSNVEHGLVLLQLRISCIVSWLNQLWSNILRCIKTILTLLFGWDFLIA